MHCGLCALWARPGRHRLAHRGRGTPDRHRPAIGSSESNGASCISKLPGTAERPARAGHLRSRWRASMSNARQRVARARARTLRLRNRACLCDHPRAPGRRCASSGLAMEVRRDGDQAPRALLIGRPSIPTAACPAYETLKAACNQTGFGWRTIPSRSWAPATAARRWWNIACGAPGWMIAARRDVEEPHRRHLRSPLTSAAGAANRAPDESKTGGRRRWQARLRHAASIVGQSNDAGKTAGRPILLRQRGTSIRSTRAATLCWASAPGC